MSTKRVNGFLESALCEAKKLSKNGEIESKYFAYVANFGVSVLQSGVFATELFYEASEERKKVLKAIKSILNYEEPIKNIKKDEVLDASTALKLAIRTFKKIDNKEGQKDE